MLLEFSCGVADTHDVERIRQSSFSRVLQAAFSLLLACMFLLLGAGESHAASASWARSSFKYTEHSNILVDGSHRRPWAMMSRAHYVQALVRLDRHLAAERGHERLLNTVSGRRGFPDAPRGSIYAKAIELGWVRRRSGGFGRRGKITADEASWGVMQVLGLGDSVNTFATRLSEAVPGARTSYRYKAAHVYTRALDMRLNHPTGSERLEIGPRQRMRTAHLAFMLHAAATANDWELAGLREYEQFEIPTLSPVQRHVLATGVRLIGQPYVWAGETENWQPEGHGGFDCSGFTVRILRGTGLSSRQVQQFGERTSMAMSAKGRRITALGRLRAGDMAFFGYDGPDSTPSENFHVGVMMGNGWMIHSAGGNAGVTIERVDDWWADQFSWGRRVLRS